MDWLNLHISVLDGPEFLGSEPIDRATWICLLRYCIGQENSGLIVDAASWGDRKWQQLCGITLSEVKRKTPLWRWVRSNLEVNLYPVKKQAEVQAKRQAGKDTVAKRWHKQDSSANSSAISSADTEGKGKGIGREGKQSNPAHEPPIDDQTWHIAKRHIKWKSNDPERAAATKQSVLDAVEMYGLKAWCRHSESLRHEHGEAQWPEAVEKALMAASEKAKQAEVLSMPREEVAADFEDRRKKWGV